MVVWSAHLSNCGCGPGSQSLPSMYRKLGLVEEIHRWRSLKMNTSRYRFGADGHYSTRSISRVEARQYVFGGR